MAGIALRQVWKRYGAVEAVRDLSLECPDGEMLALLGPSGCGKSSTLKMIAGIEAVSAGEIYFDERPVAALAPGARNIAMVFEDYALYPHLSVAENIAFPLRLRHTPAAEVARRVGQVLELLRLGPLRDENVKVLSGGAQQRVSIGRALVREPELILFDEPLSHLDADQKVELRSEIKRLQRTSGLTAILVTHDQTEAVAMADRIAVMHEGRLQQLGSPDEVYQRPANLFVAGFIGEPPMNLLPVEPTAAGGRLVLVGAQGAATVAVAAASALRQAAAKRRLVLGVRPEHLALRSPSAGNGAEVLCRGEVVFVEPRGDSTVVWVRSGSGEPSEAATLLLAEAPAALAPRPGEAVALAVAPERLLLFDADSGAALGPA